MNDNAEAHSREHAEALRLINDLHDLLRWADSAKLRVDTDNEDVHYAMDWKFWADQCADILNIRVV